MKYLVLGDIHAKFETAQRTLDKALEKHPDVDCILQVGDFGYWPHLFPKATWPGPFPCPTKFVDGNHEDHPALRSHEGPLWGVWEYMSRGSIEDGILYIGGARSIDKHARTWGLDWFPEEDISYAECQRIYDAIDSYDGTIHTVISHDCPTEFDVSLACSWEKDQMDSNRKFLSSILEMVQPKRWFFGHYHIPMSGIVGDCSWRCVARIEVEDFAVFEVDEDV